MSDDQKDLIFRDRIDAGCQLAAHPYLQKIKSLPSNERNSYLVISLPRGGTVVGDELAKQLNITHDLVFPRKIPCPGQPEFAIGAVSELGDVIWNDYARQENLIDKPQVQQSKDKQIEESRRRKQIYRGQRKPLESLSGRTVILVDDGLATGATMKSAIMTCQHLNAQSIIVAVPCGSADRVKDISKSVDKVICLTTPYGYHAVGQCYDSFDQTTDEEVIEIMAKYQGLNSENISNSGKQSIKIELDSQNVLHGDLTLVSNSIGLVLFAHGSGSSRLSPRNQYVAEQLNAAKISTFLLDLLTKNEEIEDDRTRKLRFNIPFLADRLSQVTDWLYQNNKNIQNLSIGYFGASTGGAAAIIAGGIKQQKRTKAIVSRGGRPDLVPKEQLNQLTVPTLLIVGGADMDVIKMNEEAYSQMTQLKDNEKQKALKLIPNATHLFEEKGALEQVSQLAVQWFTDNFQKH
ncbi:unnamed protein product [Rotaria sordida]|uniref:Phosphoribosyltransferase domain-containing protein n=1 Tax=Rotaria sordida TaxID=392033 RepID=A0A814WZP5_9BILA|nr:unnamed protein product [Rotaria sordida]CAF3876502.1 unnamed protein product [Rotaria sordida]